LPVVDEAQIGRLFREESGRSVAALIRIFGDIDLAEDAVQEAFTVALRKWPAEGLPPNRVFAQRRSGWRGSWRPSCPMSRRWPACWRCCS
jgi:hypothetical protein